jgi:hypothetical protein
VSGYEELAEPTDAGDITGSSLYTAEAHSTPDVHRRTRSNEENVNGGHANLSLDSLSLEDMSTPKGRHYKKPPVKQAETPYEKIQYQIEQQYRIDSSDASISRPTALDKYSALENTAQSVPEIDSPLSASSLSHDQTSTPTSTPRAFPPSTVKRRGSPSKRQGPLLHRVLDNNWRLQATPLSTAKRSIYDDIDALSSPPAPEITSQIFSPSPMGKILAKKTIQAPRRKQPDPLSDSDDDDFEKEIGMSPPVTMQFSMPASKLMKTPAKTAAMSIVEEVLRTAGAGRDISMESLRTPGRLIGGRKLSSNASEKEMWDAIRAAGTGGSSGGSGTRRKVDVGLDGSPFISKTNDLETMMLGGVEDRSTLMTMARLANGEHTSQSLNDWQESEDWLA